MPPEAIYWNGAVLVALGWLLIGGAVGFFSDETPFMLGLVVATMFQQTVLAAAWSALGPGKLLWRLPFSLGWACLMGSALALPLAIFEKVDGTIMFVITTAGFWFAGQIPIWLVSLIFGLRLRHQGYPPDAADAKSRQFGIGQLMTFTGFVALLLGAGRLVVASGWFYTPGRTDILLLGLLLATQLLITLPLLFGALLPKWSIPAMVVGLLFVIAVTYVEYPLASRIVGSSGSEEFWTLIWLNFFSVIWVLIFAAVIRASSYHFGVQKLSDAETSE